MSADNGIYIAKFSDGEHRVIHGMAIDNLNWNQDGSSDFNPASIYEYYKNAAPMTKSQARSKAFLMETDVLTDDFCPILEYGISTIKMPFTWQEVLSALDSCKCGRKKNLNTKTCTDCYFADKTICGLCRNITYQCSCKTKKE